MICMPIHSEMMTIIKLINMFSSQLPFYLLYFAIMHTHVFDANIQEKDLFF